MSDDLVKRYLLIKRGLYYAPDRQGYTGVKERAGRYREVEALGLDGVTAIHEDEAPDFSPACWGDTKIAVLTDRIEALTAENERMREAGTKLNNHACHDDDCQIVTHGVWSDPIPCTCGYEDAWKAWSAALGDTE